MKNKETVKIVEAGEEDVIHEKKINQNNIEDSMLKNEHLKFNHIQRKDPKGALLYTNHCYFFLTNHLS